MPERNTYMHTYIHTFVNTHITYTHIGKHTHIHIHTHTHVVLIKTTIPVDGTTLKQSRMAALVSTNRLSAEANSSPCVS